MTLRDLGRAKWTEIATALQEFVVLPEILRKERVGFGSGYGIQFSVMHTTSGAAEHSGLFAIDKVNVGDVMVTADVPWRHSRTSFAIERREISMNRNPARIVNLIKVRRADAMIDLAKLLESAFWGAPTGASDPAPFGIDYWVVKNSTEGFNGGNNANFSNGPANIDRDTFSTWKNYTAEYVNVTKTDLVRKWRKASTLTNFISPVSIPSFNTGNRYGYYTNYDVIGPLEESLESQNDRLGKDIASMDGALMFRRIPVRFVPELISDTQDPVYGINWGVMKPVFLRSEYLRQTGPEPASGQHNVLQTHIDLTYNFVGYDPRRLFIINKA